MSIVRVGLGENKEFGSGWDAIFGKSTPPAKPAKAKVTAKKKAVKPKKKK